MNPLAISFAVLALYLLIFILVIWRQRPFPWSHVVQYLYLIRYSLITQALLLFTASLALTSLSGMLGNFYVLTTWWEIALTTWFAILVSWVVMSTMRLTLRSGPQLFGLQELKEPPWPEGRFALLYSLAVLPTLYAIAQQSWGDPAKLALGLGVGLAVAWLLRALSFWMSASVSRFLEFVGLGRLTGRALRAAGYAQIEQHQNAMSFFVLTLLLYLSGVWLLSPDLAWSARVPALLYLHLLLLFFGLLLPGLALFFDRYRVPLSLVLLSVSFAFGLLTNTDHFFQLRGGAQGEAIAAATEPVSAAEALVNRTNQPGAAGCPVVTVVTTSGGGIRASLWTAKVLTELQRQVGDPFGRTLAVVSSVSGGSVGTMYFVDAFTEAGPPSGAALDKIVENAGRNSLTQAVWGLIYPDLWRVLFAVPGLWDRTYDRGWALEQAWRQQLTNPNITLGQWREGTAAGWRPAVIFNTTLVETGGQFMFTTVDGLKREDGSLSPQLLPHFGTVYPGYDVDVVTAARLSATFPYLTPVARAIYQSQPTAPTYHFADGGYYDNNGVAAVVEWLEAVNPNNPDNRVQRASLPGPAKKTLIIQIRASDAEPKQAAAPKTPVDASQLKRGGWLYALAGPLITLFNVNSTSQYTRGDLELRLVERAYQGQIGKQASFKLTNGSALSWQLSEAQRSQILAGWETPENQAELQAVKDFFAEQGCATS